MKRGAKPVPTKLRVLRGNPGKRSLPAREPQATQPAKVPAVPSHLSRIAAAEWRRIVGELHAIGVLTGLDLRILEAYCDTYAKVRAASIVLDKQGLTYTTTTETGCAMHRKRPEAEVYSTALGHMRAYACELGITPSARTRVQVPAKKDDDAARDDEFFARRRAPRGAS